LDGKGQIVGFDADLASQIAKDLKVELELINIPFDNIFDALEKGEVDLVISSVTITTERQKTMLFSAPYLNAGQVVVTKIGASDISSVTDLKGRKVGVQGGTTSETEAVKYGAIISKYADYDLAKSDLVAGKIDALIIDYPAGISMAQSSNERLQVTGNPFTSEFYGVVAQLTKNGLMSSVDHTISRLKSSGDLGRLQHLWFGQ
jgi:polar amino acid transport system substrate-binding protein